MPAFIQGARRSFLPWLVDPDIVKYHRRANPGRMRFRFASLFTSRITIRFGKPLAPDGYAESKADYLRLTAELERALKEMAREDPAQDAVRCMPYVRDGESVTGNQSTAVNDQERNA